MDVTLICSENIKKILEEIIQNRNFQLKEDGNLWIIEKGHDLPDAKLCIVFEMSNLNFLLELLDKISVEDPYVKDIITGKSNDSYCVIGYDEIIYFEGMGNDVYCVTKDQKYSIKEKLYEIEEKLKSKGFIRISKGYIINIVKVREIIPWFNGKLILKMENIDQEIHVSRSYSKEFKKFLGM
ncbi:MAG: LytTR family transcriptional regulator [Marinisporobacter sp.]|jgi:DNA-binding LytR/AlgR family response regulator|nr:LytTR family transcriptional regulator [Marinisporobacter sp.]